MENEIKYAAAMAEIEEIIRSIQSQPADVDALAAKVDRATKLIELCRTKLTGAEKQVNDILQ